MFCPKCGAQNHDDAVFCAKCGLPLADAASRPQAAQPQPGAQQYSRQAYTQQGTARMQGAGQAARAYGAQAAAFGSNVATNIEARKDTIHKILAAIAAAVLVFMPLGWLTIDLGAAASAIGSDASIDAMHFSVFGLANLASISDVVGSALPLGSGSEDFTDYSAGFGFLAFLWYLGVIALVVTAITQLVGVARRNLVGIVGFGLSFVTSLSMIVIIARVHAQIKDEIAEYGFQYVDMATSMITGSPWLWIVFIGSIVGLAFSIFFLIKKSN